MDRIRRLRPGGLRTSFGVLATVGMIATGCSSGTPNPAEAAADVPPARPTAEAVVEDPVTEPTVSEPTVGPEVTATPTDTPVESDEPAADDQFIGLSEFADARNVPGATTEWAIYEGATRITGWSNGDESWDDTIPPLRQELLDLGVVEPTAEQWAQVWDGSVLDERVAGGWSTETTEGRGESRHIQAYYVNDAGQIVGRTWPVLFDQGSEDDPVMEVHAVGPGYDQVLADFPDGEAAFDAVLVDTWEWVLTQPVR